MSLGYKRLELSRRAGKSTPSIIATLQRETVRLSHMQDVAGSRIIVEYLSDQDELIRRLRRKSSRCTIDDRREKLSDAAYPNLKYGEGPSELVSELLSLSEHELEFDQVKNELARLEKLHSGSRRPSPVLVTPAMIAMKQRLYDRLARELDKRFKQLGGL